MLTSLARNWWILLLNGLCAIIFGVMAFAWPSVVLWTLIMFFGVFCIVDGITAVMASFSKDESGRSWLMMLIGGVLSIVAGILAFSWPALTGYMLLMMIAIWAIAKGLFEIIAAIQLRQHIKNEWMLIAAGVVSILFGIVMIARPEGGALAIIWLIASMAIARGVLLVILSLRLWSLDRTLQGASNQRGSRSTS